MDGHSPGCGQQLSGCVDTMVFFRGFQVVLVLFNLVVTDLDSAVECTFSKFVGDINFYDVVNTVKRRDAIQRDRDKLQRWVYENIVKINKTMCKDVHMGQSNAMHKCKLTQNDNALPHSDGHLPVDRALQSC